jgi:hypothetical protein
MNMHSIQARERDRRKIKREGRGEPLPLCQAKGRLELEPDKTAKEATGPLPIFSFYRC